MQDISGTAVAYIHRIQRIVESALSPLRMYQQEAVLRTILWAGGEGDR
jgi:hypothetical protein